MQVKFIVLAIATVLTACGGQQSNSSASGLPNSPIFQRQPLNVDKMVLEKDLRPVDGALEEVIYVRGADGKYTVTLHTNFYDRLNSNEVDSVEELGSGLACFKTFANYSCSRDDRPVDGALLTIDAKVTGDDDGETYAVSATFNWVDRTTGEDKSETKEIAEGLKMRPVL